MATTDAPYHEQGFIARALKWLRVYADEPADVDRRFTDAELCLAWGESTAALMTELYAAADYPPKAVHSFTTVAAQQHYKLPPNVQEITRIACLDSTTGLPNWVVVPDSPRAPWGPNFLLDGLQDFQLLPIPQDGGDTITIEYVPGGPVLFHQQATPIYEGPGDTGTLRHTSTTFKLWHRTDTGWLVGGFDKRPNAFVGSRLRLLGSITDGKPATMLSPWIPVQERRIESYSMDDGLKLTVAPAFDSSWLNTSSTWAAWLNAAKTTLPGDSEARSYVVYEVLPDLDPALVGLGAIAAALDLCTAGTKGKKIVALSNLFQRRKRALLMKWSQPQTIASIHMDTTQSSADAWSGVQF